MARPPRNDIVRASSSKATSRTGTHRFPGAQPCVDASDEVADGFPRDPMDLHRRRLVRSVGQAGPHRLEVAVNSDSDPACGTRCVVTPQSSRAPHRAAERSETSM